MTEISDFKAFNTNIVDEFRANGGKVGGRSRARPIAAHDHGRQVWAAAAVAAGLPDDRRQDRHRRLQGRAPIRIPTGCTICGPTHVRTSRSVPDDYDVDARELPAAERDEVFRRSSQLHRGSATTSRRPAGSSRCSNSTAPERDFGVIGRVQREYCSA